MKKAVKMYFGKSSWAKRRYISSDDVEAITLNYKDGTEYKIRLEDFAIEAEIERPEATRPEEVKEMGNKSEDTDTTSSVEEDSE